MGVMLKFRGMSSIFIIMIALGMLIIFTLSDVNFFGIINTGPTSLGEIGNEKISLQQYRNALDRAIAFNQEQNNNVITPEVRAGIEEEVWQQLVLSGIMNQVMEKIGIEVTNEEIVSLIAGNNPDPIVRDLFVDTLGNFDRQALLAAINDPNAAEGWWYIENQLREQKKQQKFTTFMQQGVDLNYVELENVWLRSKTTLDISFLFQPYGLSEDMTTSISEEEIRNYYDTHKERYKVSENYDISYVSYDISPTKQDTLNTIDDLRLLRREFANADTNDIESFFQRYQSITRYNDVYVNKDDIKEEFSGVLDLADGEVSDVIISEGYFHLLKKVDVKSDDIRLANFSWPIDRSETIDNNLDLASDFAYYATQNGFDEAVNEYNLNAQKSFATKGEDVISGLGISSQVSGFLERAQVDEVSAPYELGDVVVVVVLNQREIAGFRSYEEVKAQIKLSLEDEMKKNEVWTTMKNALIGLENDTLGTIASKLNIELRHQESVSPYLSYTINGIGNEPAVFGYISELEEGEVSTPIIGNFGVYVVRINKKIIPEETLDIGLLLQQPIYTSLIIDKQNKLFSDWTKDIIKGFDIVDNRSYYFR